MIRQVFYLSEVTPGTNDQAVRVILASSRVNNWRLDITGLLMCSGRHFAQVLEGRSEAVAQLVEKLHGDPRHRRIRVLVDDVSSLRKYGDWSMGYLHSERVSDELDRLAGSAPVSSWDANELLRSLHPDTVMGSLS